MKIHLNHSIDGVREINVDLKSQQLTVDGKKLTIEKDYTIEENDDVSCISVMFDCRLLHYAEIQKELS